MGRCNCVVLSSCKYVQLGGSHRIYALLHALRRCACRRKISWHSAHLPEAACEPWTSCAHCTWVIGLHSLWCWTSELRYVVSLMGRSRTPLMKAAEEDNATIIQLLLDKGPCAQYDTSIAGQPRGSWPSGPQAQGATMSGRCSVAHFPFLRYILCVHVPACYILAGALSLCPGPQPKHGPDLHIVLRSWDFAVVSLAFENEL